MHVIVIGGSAGAVTGLARCAATDAVITRLTIAAAAGITNRRAGVRMGFMRPGLIMPAGGNGGDEGNGSHGGTGQRGKI